MWGRGKRGRWGVEGETKVRRGPSSQGRRGGGEEGGGRGKKKWEDRSREASLKSRGNEGGIDEVVTQSEEREGGREVRVEKRWERWMGGGSGREG